MPVPDLIVARNRHLRLASFSYRAVTPFPRVGTHMYTKKYAQPGADIADINVSNCIPAQTSRS